MAGYGGDDSSFFRGYADPSGRLRRSYKSWERLSDPLGFDDVLRTGHVKSNMNALIAYFSSWRAQAAQEAEEYAKRKSRELDRNLQPLLPPFDPEKFQRDQKHYKRMTEDAERKSLEIIREGNEARRQREFWEEVKIKNDLRKGWYEAEARRERGDPSAGIDIIRAYHSMLKAEEERCGDYFQAIKNLKDDGFEYPK